MKKSLLVLKKRLLPSFEFMFDSVARLRIARAYLTSVLLNLPILTNDTSVSSLLNLLDFLAENPDKYIEMIHVKYQKK